MRQTHPCSNSWNRPRFGLFRRSYIPGNVSPNPLKHMGSNQHADSQLYERIPSFLIVRVPSVWFEGRSSHPLEQECAPLCQRQKSPVFPSGLSSWAYHNHQPRQDFVYGVYTPYAKLPGHGNVWLYVFGSLPNLRLCGINHKPPLSSLSRSAGRKSPRQKI